MSWFDVTGCCSTVDNNSSSSNNSNNSNGCTNVRRGVLASVRVLVCGFVCEECNPIQQ